MDPQRFQNVWRRYPITVLKKYVLQEGVPVPISGRSQCRMTAESKVVKSRYDKFRQDQPFLRFIEDVLRISIESDEYDH